MKPKMFYIKIFFSILVAFLVIQTYSNKVFIANTPKVNPEIIYMVKNLPQTLIGLPSSINNYLAQISPKRDNQSITTNITTSSVNRTFAIRENIGKLEKSLENDPFIPLAKGVYAKSNENGTVAKIVIDEIDWVEYTFNVNGKEIKIKVPKGETPPPKESVEKLY